MMSKFDKLSDIADVIDSLHKTPKYSDEGQAMVRCTDVKYGKLNLANTFKVNEKVFAEFSRRYTPRKEDIIITRVGSYGITAIVDELDFCLGQNTSVIVPKDINPRYLYLALNSPYVKNQIEFSVVGSTQKTLSLKAINSLDIPRFDPKVEEKISKIGGELDDKIELNRQTNQTLEQIAQAIFKSWFVDFEPTRAKIEARANIKAGKMPGSDQPLPANFSKEDDTQLVERAAMAAISGKTVEQLEQLDAATQKQLKETAALFPDALVDSELGEVPEGWEVKLNGDVMDVRDGTHDSPKQSDVGYPLVTSKHITSGALEIASAYLISKEDYDKVNKRSQVGQGDILLTMIGTVGFSYLVMQPTVDFAIKNVGLFRTSKVKKLRYYFYLLLNTSEMKNYLDARMAGTTQKYLSLKTLRSIEMLVPTNEILEKFNEVVNSLMKMIFTNLEENKSLAVTRDSLLPKLLSGELDVRSKQSGVEKTA